MDRAAARVAIAGGVARAVTVAGFWNRLPNASTNFNRKRAAYALKRYFCDDLNPVGIVANPDYARGDRHGSAPSALRTIGRPLDWSTARVRDDLPSGFVSSDYLSVSSVVNTIQNIFGRSKESYWLELGGKETANLVPRLST